MKQTSGSMMTYSADTFGVCSALYELGGMVVMHDASGCNSTYTTHDEPRWYDMDSMVYISGISETEAVLGEDQKFVEDICDAAAELSPAFIAICGTPIPTMTGFDFEGVANVIEGRSNIPTMGFKTTGMASYLKGAELAFCGYADRFVDRSVTRSELPSANLLGVTPLDFSINTQVDSLKQWVKEQGYELNACWSMGCTTEALKNSGRAHHNFVVSSDGIALAKKLQEWFGTPYTVGVPVAGESLDLQKEGMYLGKDYESRFLFGDAADVNTVFLGEGVFAASLARWRYVHTGEATLALDTTLLYEDDVKQAVARAKTVVGDPLFRPLVPAQCRFVVLPHEAFSGRIFRNEIPDVIRDGMKVEE